MKLSTFAMAALLGFGGLVRGRPQEVAGGSITPDQISGSSGNNILPTDINTDANTFSENTNGPGTNTIAIADEPTNGNGQLDNSNSDDISLALPDPGHNTLGLPEADWAKDVKTLEQVQSGELRYALYKRDYNTPYAETRQPIIVTQTLPMNSPSVWQIDLWQNLQIADLGYAIIRTAQDQVVPELFALTVNAGDFDHVKNYLGPFVDFNAALGLGDIHLDIIYDWHDFSTKYLKNI